MSVLFLLLINCNKVLLVGHTIYSLSSFSNGATSWGLVSCLNNSLLLIINCTAVEPKGVNCFIIKGINLDCISSFLELKKVNNLASTGKFDDSNFLVTSNSWLSNYSI